MKKLNTTGIYVFAVLSLLCCCFGGLGVFLALPAFLIANSKYNEVSNNLESYEDDALSTMNTAKIVALVALIVNGLYFLYNVYYFSTTDWDVIMEQYQKAMEQYQR